MRADVLTLCPRDGSELVEVTRNGVTIDACPACRGIWLDRGELEKLIASERPESNDDFLEEVTGRSSTDDQADREKADDAHSGKRRRGSFLENFLDFGGD